MLSRILPDFTVTVACLALLALSLAQNTSDLNPSKPTQIDDEKARERRASFPSVNFWDSGQQASDLARRGEKYNRLASIDPNITANSTEAVATHWQAKLDSSLPVENSQVVALGTAKKATAHLSPNNRSVFSVFQIEIETLYKDTSGKNFKNGDRVLAERRGGIVRFAGGFEQWVFIIGQGMPVEGAQYLFFLTYSSPEIKRSNDLFILTAYRIGVGGEVKPLDDVDNDQNLTTFYRGKHGSSLLSDLLKKMQPTD